ncbi:ribose transport system substrate-binding protein [Oxalobacteraceae bacterium GrIS 2.11]
MQVVRMVMLFAFATIMCSCDRANNPASPSGSSGSATTAVKKRIVVALILKTQTNPFFIAMERGARRAEKEFGIKLITKGGSQETFVQEQIQIVEDVIESGVDAIVLAPSDSELLVPVVKKAQDAGIKVINIDNSLDQKTIQNLHMQAIPFVSVDNEKAGYEVVRSVIDSVNKPAQAAIIAGMPGAENGRLRIQGARRAFRENAAIKIVGEDSAHWKIDEAHDVAKKLFSAHPAIHVLFCANDMMALGAVQYVAESRRKDVLIIGYDALDEAKEAVRAGRMAATLDQQAGEQGYQGVVYALRALKGEKLPPTLLVDTKVVNAATFR